MLIKKIVPRLILQAPISNCNSLDLFILWRIIRSNNVHLKENISNHNVSWLVNSNSTPEAPVDAKSMN